MTSEPELLAIDIGSSSVRGHLYGSDLRRAGCPGDGVRRYRWRTDGGAMEFDAPVLVELVAQVVDASLAEVRRRGGRVGGVVVASFWHGVLGLDSGGIPLTPVYAWGDSRAGAAAVELHRRIDPEAYHQRTGCFLHSSYPAAKLLWLRQVDPVGFSSVAVWGSLGEYLEWRLFGSPRCSISIASGTGLFDIHRLEWDDEALAAVGLSTDRLAPVVDLEARRGLAGEWAVRWPELAEVPWFPALGDGACANVGSGAVGGDRPGITIGTSAAARVVTEDSPSDEVPGDLWCYRLDRRHRAAGGAFSNGGNGLAFLLERFPQVHPGEVDAVLRAAPPDAHGLTVVPSLVQERGLGWTESERASLSGLHPGTESLDIVVAWLEALAQRLAELVDRIEQRYEPAVELRASGGALHKIPGWLQTIADATGRPVRLGSDREATSRGAAIVGARELGWISSLKVADSPEDVREIVLPDPDRREAHAQALERQHRMAQAIRRAQEVTPPPRDATHQP